MKKSIQDMSPREMEALLREHGASRQMAKAMTADLVRSRSEPDEVPNPFDGPETSAAIARMLAVSKQRSIL